MEYIQGESLSQLAKISNEAGKPVPHDIVRTVMSGVLHGLHAAHEAKSERGEPLGIVHRDVSPQNILVGTDGVARLLDFGVAKAISRAHVTRDRHIKGKLSYMAPEQIQNTEVDRRVDVYAAAVVTWELLSGKRLFLADSESETLARVLTSPVTSPSAESGTIAYKLDQVVLRGLKRAREGRFPTARDMALALEASGRLATVSAVGEWVEQTAQQTLAARAADISAVEQIANMPSAAPSSKSLRVARKLELVSECTKDALAPDIGVPENVPPSGTTSFVEDSSVELVPAGPSAPEQASVEAAPKPAPSNQKRKRMAAAVGLLAVLTTLLVWFGRKHHPSPTTEPGPSTLVVQALPAAPVTASAREPASDTRQVAVRTNEAKALAGSQPASIVHQSSKAMDCNPPYTVDEAGIRHYKRKCL
jgi:serine/threonine-protein kinase